jgi:hypothetical protein
MGAKGRSSLRTIGLALTCVREATWLRVSRGAGIGKTDCDLAGFDRDTLRYSRGFSPTRRKDDTETRRNQSMSAEDLKTSSPAIARIGLPIVFGVMIEIACDLPKHVVHYFRTSIYFDVGRGLCRSEGPQIFGSAWDSRYSSWLRRSGFLLWGGTNSSMASGRSENVPWPDQSVLRT